MHRERVLKALAQLLVGVENKLHLADRRRRREDKLIERARLLEIQRAQNKTNLKDADANGKISYRIGAYMQMKKLEEVYTNRELSWLQFNERVLNEAGIMDLDEFAALPRTTRDVLVSVIVPKNAKGVVYLSQRNQSTDFPVLTCAVANRSGRYVAVIGASPYMAEPVWDEEGILDCLADAKTDGNAALTDNSENNAKIDKFAEYVAEHIRFGSNIRAGAEYREIICRVLTRRAVTQSLDICDDIKHEH